MMDIVNDPPTLMMDTWRDDDDCDELTTTVNDMDDD